MIKKTHLISAVGAVAGASFALGTFAADAGDNPFEVEELDTGTLFAQANFGEGSCGEGSCGEGSCGEDDDDDDEGEGSCGEGSCGEGSCGSS